MKWQNRRDKHKPISRRISVIDYTGEEEELAAMYILNATVCVSYVIGISVTSHNIFISDHEELNKRINRLAGVYKHSVQHMKE